MKTAVLLSGQMRTADICLPSIQKHVLDKIGDYDVIAHIADDEDAWKLELFEPKKAFVGTQPVHDEKNYLHRTGRGVIGIQQVLRMFHSMQESNRLRQSLEVATGVAYDWIIRLRPDTQFFSDIEPLAESDPGAIYIPTFCNYWGYQDRFSFGGSAAMNVYHEKFDLIDEYVAAGGIFHPESMLKWMIDRAGTSVKRTSILFDTLRKNGSRIRPDWQSVYGDVLPPWKQRALTAA